MRSNGLVPAADAESFGFSVSLSSRTLHFHVAFFPFLAHLECRQIHCTKIALQAHYLSDLAHSASALLKLANVLSLCAS